MPVRRYRRVEDVPAADGGTGDPARDLAAALALSELANRLSRWRPPRGVHRNRSLAEAQDRRASWEAREAREDVTREAPGSAAQARDRRGRYPRTPRTRGN